MGIPNVKQKLTITGGGAPSITGIQNALGTLRQLGAPAEGGKLTLQQNINGWAIFIEWTPEDPVEDDRPTAEPLKPIPGDWDFKTAQRIQRDSGTFRKLKDNPQA